jgi:hypothetical protein
MTTSGIVQVLEKIAATMEVAVMMMKTRMTQSSLKFTLPFNFC